MKSLNSAALAISLLCMSMSAHASSVVDIDATTNYFEVNPVQRFLDAGTYSVTPFAGTWSAWSPWNSDSCDPGPCPLGTAQGWLNFYIVVGNLSDINVGGVGVVTPGGYEFNDGLVYKDAASALAAAESSMFTLKTAGTVGFGIGDAAVSDNRGGMSLYVQRLPEPGTLSLLAIGLAGIGWIRRHKIV